MDRLELVKPRLGPAETQTRRLLHQAQLGVDVGGLFGIGELVPRCGIWCSAAIQLGDGKESYHALRCAGLVHGSADTAKAKSRGQRISRNQAIFTRFVECLQEYDS